MQMNGFLDRRVLNVRRPLKYIIITEVVCRHPLLRHTRRRFYPPEHGRMRDYFISYGAVQRKTFWRKGEEA